MFWVITPRRRPSASRRARARCAALDGRPQTPRTSPSCRASIGGAPHRWPGTPGSSPGGGGSRSRPGCGSPTPEAVLTPAPVKATARRLTPTSRRAESRTSSSLHVYGHGHRRGRPRSPRSDLQVEASTPPACTHTRPLRRGRGRAMWSARAEPQPVPLVSGARLRAAIEALEQMVPLLVATRAPGEVTLTRTQSAVTSTVTRAGQPGRLNFFALSRRFSTASLSSSSSRTRASSGAEISASEAPGRCTARIRARRPPG